MASLPEGNQLQQRPDTPSKQRGTSQPAEERGRALQGAPKPGKRPYNLQKQREAWTEKEHQASERPGPEVA